MRPLPLLVLLFTLTFIASGYLIPFDGYDGTQVPIPQEDPPIQPAGWAFAIWLVIYGWLLVSAVFGLLRRAGDPDWDRVRLPLLLSLILGTPWVAIANASAIWATVVIFGMLGTAVWALLRAPVRDRWWLQGARSALCRMAHGGGLGVAGEHGGRMGRRTGGPRLGFHRHPAGAADRGGGAGGQAEGAGICVDGLLGTVRDRDEERAWSCRASRRSRLRGSWCWRSWTWLGRQRLAGAG
jgi:hypothetical protein